MGKLKVLYFLHQYPQISQTYIENEISALGDEYDVSIISAMPPDATYKSHRPYRMLPRGLGLREVVLREKFDVLHAHWMLQAPFLASVAKATNTPFTIRAHSFESYVPDHKPPQRHLAESAAGINSELCLKVFCLPFTRKSLERVGISPHKLEDYNPIVDYPRFLNRTPNGDAVMNIGACTPKKGDEGLHRPRRRAPGQANLQPLRRGRRGPRDRPGQRVQPGEGLPGSRS